MTIYSGEISDAIQEAHTRSYRKSLGDLPAPIHEDGAVPHTDDNYDDAKRIWDAIVSSST